MSVVNVCFWAIQGKDCLIAEQNARFRKPTDELKLTFNLRSISEENSGVEFLSTAALRAILFSVDGLYATHDVMASLFAECG